jgi:hypothetical protein
MSVGYPSFEELDEAVKKNPTITLSISNSGPNILNSGPIISVPDAKEIGKWRETYHFPPDFMKPRPDPIFEALDKAFNPDKNGAKQFGYDLQDGIRKVVTTVLGPPPEDKPKDDSSLLLLLGAGGLILVFFLLK